MISILYVDDENSLLLVTKAFLERTGEFSVTTCASAKDALDLLISTPFDAVVSDYQMPVMDGLLFLKHIRSAGNTIPFILFTGKGREEVAIEALNSGADFYLQKGGEPKSQFAELTNKVRQAVQRRQTESALRSSEEKYREMVENINDIIFTVDDNGILTYVSPMIRQFGYRADDLIGKPVRDIVAPEDISLALGHFADVKDGNISPQEFRIADAAGGIRVVRISSRPITAEGRVTGIRGILTDITLPRTAQARIAASEQRYRNVFEAAGDGLLVVDSDSGVILDANGAALCLFGAEPGELTGKNLSDITADPPPHPDDDPAVFSAIPVQYYRKKDGSVFPAGVARSTYPQKKRTICILSIRDLTEQKRAEEQIIAQKRLYAVLSQINQCIVRVKDLETLLAEICRITVEYGKFRMSWVGLLDRSSGMFHPVASAGYDDGYLRALAMNEGGNPPGHSPTGTALRNGQHSICNDIEADYGMEPWGKEALRRGYRASAAIPFRLHGEIVGAYMIYSSRQEVFNENEIALLEEIALDISFALDMLDERARRTHAESALAGSEERVRFFAEALEISSQPFGVAYPGGGFGFVNPAFCDLIGYQEPELSDLTWNGITPSEYHDREAAAIGELSRTGTPQRYEKEYLRKDGCRVPVEVFIHRVVDEGGNILFFYAFVTDISERIKNQKILKAERDRAQQYLDTAGVMLAALDLTGRIVLINHKGCEILGYSEQDLLGRNWFDTCLPDRVKDEVSGVFGQIAKGEIVPAEYHENAVLTRDGWERILAFHNTIIRDDNGTITGILFSGEDITLRRKMELDLRESEERFRNLIQNSSDMIRIIGKDGLIIYSSPSTLRITGYNPDDVVGRNPIEFVHPDDTTRVAGALQEVEQRTNPGIPTEYRIRHANGTYIYVEAVAINLLDVAGINGIVTTTRPITERKKAEEVLRGIEGRYRAMFDNSADAIFVAGETVLDCNGRAERLFGCSRDDLIGTTTTGFSPEKQPSGQMSAGTIATVLQAAREGHVQTFSWMHCTKDGREFPARVTLIPITAPGEARVIVIIHDASEQSRDGQQYRHLARIPELNPNPVIEILRNREIVYANPATRSILRRLEMPSDPAAFIPGDFDSLVTALQSEEVPELFREVRIGTALFGLFISFDPKDQIIRIYAHDITRQSFEKDALGEANARLNRLGSITRHDIKNKLTGVMGYLELARGSTRDPELIEYLNRAEISATAVRQQIEFTKEYENLGMTAPLWQDFTTVVQTAKTGLGRDAVPVDDETRGLFVYADPLLPRVIHCLFENAVTHGKPLTKIQVHGSKAPSGYLLLVEDDGTGIPAEQKEKIFSKRVGRDAGSMGLFVAREILSITGITVEETGMPGKGARFAISIPRGKFQIKSSEWANAD